VEANAYTGEAVVRSGPHTLTLRMRYRELAALRTKFGSDWPAQYELALKGDPILQAQILAIMTGMSEEDLLDLSPPLGLVSITAPMIDMFYVAQYGPEWQEKLKESKEEREKDNPFWSLIQSLTGSRQPPTSASRPQTSGP